MRNECLRLLGDGAFLKEDKELTYEEHKSGKDKFTIEELKKKYETGNYICVFKNEDITAGYLYLCESTFLQTNEYKLIHKKHEDVLKAFLDGKEVYSQFGKSCKGILKNFLEEYNENFIYGIKETKSYCERKFKVGDFVTGISPSKLSIFGRAFEIIDYDDIGKFYILENASGFKEDDLRLFDTFQIMKEIENMSEEKRDDTELTCGEHIETLKSQFGGFFKDIEDYEGLYYMDKAGNVYSYGNKSNHNEDITLSPSVDKDGYRKVTLYKDGKKGYYRVCRLMGIAWLPNPLGLDFINHKNEAKDDDSLDNLEWISPYNNWKHSEASQSNQELSVIKLSLVGDYICEYKSLMDAARDNGINQGNITNCLAGRCKTVGGFRWLKK